MTFNLAQAVAQANADYFSPDRVSTLCASVPAIAARSYVLASKEEREEMTRNYMRAVKEIDALAVKMQQERDK